MMKFFAPNYAGKDKFVVAIVGATGLVGRTMVEMLEAVDFPVERLKLLATEQSAGKLIDFNGAATVVQTLEEASFHDTDFALFSAGAPVAKQFAPLAVEAGCTVIDNSSAFRMEPDVPLVVPEINPQAIETHKGIIANPNCSTIQMVMALKPLHDYAHVKRVVVSTYQSVSGKGKAAMDELFEQTRDMLGFQDPVCQVFPYRIAFNCLPQCDVFLENDDTKEERKMVSETQKIFDSSIKVSATAVRVPVFNGHSEAVNIEFENPCPPMKARELLSQMPGISVIDDPKQERYPMASEIVGKHDVFVGRIRRDETVRHGLNLWIVADNLIKGAALNAVQIAQRLVELEK